MKRTLSALALCLSLLVLLSVFLFPPVKAKEDPMMVLLSLPAPAPPNPLIAGTVRKRDEAFYDKSKPPADNAPVEELLDYWEYQSQSFRDLGYNPKPSDRVAARLYAEIEKDPKRLLSLINSLPDEERAGALAKEIYDREGANGVFDRSERESIKRWLTYHTSFFSSDLARVAQQAGEAGEYVSNHEEVLALARVDYDRAKPIVDRLASDSSQRVSQVLAKWAQYRHALETESLGDVETYRDELKAVVEDKRATPGMRDLALDALIKEKEWNGRDEWYYSLLGDETLADLRVNGSSYTGLTTPLYYAPDEKYIDKMLELVRSDNPVIRAAAVRNLVLKLNTRNIEIAKALIPWLEDPKWAVEINDARGALVRQLSEFEVPESVPGLIKILDEKQTQMRPAYGANVSNAAANAMSASANLARFYNTNASNAPATNTVPTTPVTTYPYRYSAVAALGKQKDPRAVPALRRVFPDGEGYERHGVVRAILMCRGFSITEQLDALEVQANGVPEDSVTGVPSIVTALNATLGSGSGSAAEMKALLGQALVQSEEISDELARALVARIEAVDKTNPTQAAAYRKMILRWQNAAINILLLSDVKRGRADADSMIRLLSQRKALRDNQASDVVDLRSGGPGSLAFAACLLNDAADHIALLDTGSTENKIALLACARLIRTPLPVAKVAELLGSPNAGLVTAAERYLESEDSAEARQIVLSRHPNEARIMGATSAFFVEGAADSYNEYLWMLYQSLGDESLYNGWTGSGNDDDLRRDEKRLREEIKKSEDLAGIYAYDGHYIRIYKDRVIFSWNEDESRYRERPLSKTEFDEVRSYIAVNRLDELPPFLSCGGEYCEAKELVMVGKAGGRRVYTNGDTHAIFAGLEKLFAGFKQSPATLKYTLSSEIPGLEIILAADELRVATVWKNGDDLRVAASATAIRKKIKDQIEAVGEDDENVNGYDEIEAKRAEFREKHLYDGISWFRVTANGAEAGAAQPPGVEFIPLRDGHAVQVSDEQWKARTATFEIRASEEGLFKLAGGKLTKLRSGNYSTPLVTPGGRWLFATKLANETGNGLVRIDLVTNREYPVKPEGYGTWYASAFVPTLNKVLLARDDNYGYEYHYDDEDDAPPIETAPDGLMLADPATGALQPITGEFRPLDQQTFRPLQKAAKPNEFWAAILDVEKNETEVGIYDTKYFGFKPVLRIPKIKFNSMNMWVDEPGNKVYFVYRGHLLALPLTK